MDIEDLDRLTVEYRILLNEKNSKKLSDLLARAYGIANKEEARHLRTRADTLVFRELLSQHDMGSSFLDSAGTNQFG